MEVRTMTFKIWDGQLKQYSFEEHIFEDEEEAIEQLIDYFSIDHTKIELKIVRKNLQQNKEWAELYIEEVQE